MSYFFSLFERRHWKRTPGEHEINIDGRQCDANGVYADINEDHIYEAVAEGVVPVIDYMGAADAPPPTGQVCSTDYHSGEIPDGATAFDGQVAIANYHTTQTSDGASEETCVVIHPVTNEASYEPILEGNAGMKLYQTAHQDLDDLPEINAIDDSAQDIEPEGDVKITHYDTAPDGFEESPIAQLPSTNQVTVDATLEEDIVSNNTEQDSLKGVQETNF